MVKWNMVETEVTCDRDSFPFLKESWEEGRDGRDWEEEGKGVRQTWDKLFPSEAGHYQPTSSNQSHLLSTTHHLPVIHPTVSSAVGESRMGLVLSYSSHAPQSTSEHEPLTVCEDSSFTDAPCPLLHLQSP